MDLNAASTVPHRPGKNSFWTPRRGAARDDGALAGPGSTQPPSVPASSLDAVRAAFWEACRHLFPPHAPAAQTANGSVVISWSIRDDPHAKYSHAAPVMLRFDAAVLELMAASGARQRTRIAQNHDPTLREGLRGYDPYARFPNARVINIG
jgi:hypothetical protein